MTMNMHNWERPVFAPGLDEIITSEVEPSPKPFRFLPKSNARAREILG